MRLLQLVNGFIKAITDGPGSGIDADTVDGLHAADITGTGLETIDEGNGDGLVKIGRTAANYGNIGLNAVDLSYSNSISSTFGATGELSNANGYSVIANGYASHANGVYTIAQNYASYALGKYNIGTDSNTILEIGMGTGTTARKNAFEVYTDGVVTAPEVTYSEIDAMGNIALITKGYADFKYSPIIHYHSGVYIPMVNVGVVTTDPNTTLEALILTNNSNGPGTDDSTTYWYITTKFYLSVGTNANRTQTAQPYNGTGSTIFFRHCRNNVWTTWRKIWTTSNAPESKSINGYIKYPNGLILQYGFHNYGTSLNIYYPIAFPSYVRSITQVPLMGDTAANFKGISIGTYTRTYFHAKPWGHAGGSTDASFFWMAMGY